MVLPRPPKKTCPRRSLKSTCVKWDIQAMYVVVFNIGVEQ